MPGHAHWEGNSRMRPSSWKRLSIHLKMPGSQPDHKKPRPGGQGKAAQRGALQNKPDLTKQSSAPGVLARRKCAKGGTLVYLPCSSLSESAWSPSTCLFSQVTSSPTKSSRVFILPPPILESQHASVCREQDTVMVTARRPPVSGPACCLQRLPRSPAEALPFAIPSQLALPNFYPPGSWEKRSDLPTDTFKGK